MYLHLDMALLVGGPRQAHSWGGGGGGVIKGVLWNITFCESTLNMRTCL